MDKPLLMQTHPQETLWTTMLTMVVTSVKVVVIMMMIIQGVSAGIVNILGGGSKDYSE